MPLLRTLLLSTIFIGLCYGSNAKQSGDANPVAPQAENLLSVSVEVVAQSYCHVDDQSFSVNMNLKLHFTNVSGHAVILSRKIESPHIVRAARDIDAGRQGDFLYSPDVHFMVAELPKSPTFKNTPDSRLFVLLNAAESFDTTAHTVVLAANDEPTLKKPVHGLLSNGSYVLQVAVSTWPYKWPYYDTKTDSRQLKQRWAKYGELSDGLVYSDFAPFVIPEHFKNPRCK